MSDYQRQKEYRSEWAVTDMTKRLPSVEHVRALVRLIERLDCFPADKRGITVSSTFQTGKAFYREGAIHLPARGLDNGEWAWTDLTVCHEVCHHLDLSGTHGPVFTHYLLRILDGLGRHRLAAALREQYEANGVEVYARTA